MTVVDLSQMNSKMKKLLDVKKEVMRPAYDYFKKITPKKSGNARSKTKLDKDVIKADYKYAQILDEGKSKQAPKGMSAPTIDQIKKMVETYINKNGSK